MEDVKTPKSSVESASAGQTSMDRVDNVEAAPGQASSVNQISKAQPHLMIPRQRALLRRRARRSQCRRAHLCQGLSRPLWTAGRLPNRLRLQGQRKLQCSRGLQHMAAAPQPHQLPARCQQVLAGPSAVSQLRHSRSPCLRRLQPPLLLHSSQPQPLHLPLRLTCQLTTSPLLQPVHLQINQQPLLPAAPLPAMQHYPTVQLSRAPPSLPRYHHQRPSVHNHPPAILSCSADSSRQRRRQQTAS